MFCPLSINFESLWISFIHCLAIADGGTLQSSSFFLPFLLSSPTLSPSSPPAFSVAQSEVLSGPVLVACTYAIVPAINLPHFLCKGYFLCFAPFKIASHIATGLVRRKACDTMEGTVFSSKNGFLNVFLPLLSNRASQITFFRGSMPRNPQFLSFRKKHSALRLYKWELVHQNGYYEWWKLHRTAYRTGAEHLST